MPLYTWSVLIDGEAVSVSAVDESLQKAREQLKAVIARDYTHHAAQGILRQIDSHPPAQILAKEAAPSPPSNAGRPRKVVWLGTAIALLVAIVWAHSAWKAGLGFYPLESVESHWIIAGLVIGSALAVFSILFGIHFLRTGDGLDAKLWGSTLRVWKVCLLAPWVILPPIWFSVEYYYLYPKVAASLIAAPPAKPATRTDERENDSETAKDSLERFKQGQEESAKVWLALVTLLTGIYFGKELGGKAEE
ncbi:MAG TPA: hypothetical protein VH639_20190 [Bryobacteraceae bacterium]|jgi:hypothetical protein